MSVDGDWSCRPSAMGSSMWNVARVDTGPSSAVLTAASLDVPQIAALDAEAFANPIKRA